MFLFNRSSQDEEKPKAVLKRRELDKGDKLIEKWLLWNMAVVGVLLSYDRIFLMGVVSSRTTPPQSTGCNSSLKDCSLD